MNGHAGFLPAEEGGEALELSAGFVYQPGMKEPSPRNSRLVLAGTITAALVMGGVGFALGRGTTQRAPAATAPPVIAPAPAPVPDPSPTSAVLGRADLIELAAAAADAAAAGRAPGPEVARADGRRFELRLPFGCNGPAEQDSTAPMRWRYDADSNALRVVVEPVTWAASDWFAAADGVEAVEGFWIARPWTTSEACPPGGERPVPTDINPVTLPGQTLAVGQVFFSGGARGGRRGDDPYQTVVRIPEEELDASQGFRLRLNGRISRARNAGPVSCRQPAGSEQRPICLVSVELNEVAIENPATGETLATWNTLADTTGR